jgi:hypothetical protein
MSLGIEMCRVREKNIIIEATMDDDNCPGFVQTSPPPPPFLLSFVRCNQNVRSYFDQIAFLAGVMSANPFHAPSPIVTRLRNTTLCRKWESGFCNRKEKCAFAHGVHELQNKPNLRKTEMCRYFNKCTKGPSCQFAHNYKEIRSINKLPSENDPSVNVAGESFQNKSHVGRFHDLLFFINVCCLQTDPINCSKIEKYLEDFAPDKYED